MESVLITYFFDIYTNINIKLLIFRKKNRKFEKKFLNSIEWKQYILKKKNS